MNKAGAAGSLPPVRGELTRGVATSYAAKPLSQHFVGSTEPPPVWPDTEGTMRGMMESMPYQAAHFLRALDNSIT